MTPPPGATTRDSGHTALLDIAYMQTFNLLHRGQNILDLTNNADAIFPLDPLSQASVVWPGGCVECSEYLLKISG